MPVYLQTADFDEYSIRPGSEPQVLEASVVIDGLLQRPEGLFYVESGGQPSAMEATGQPVVEEGKVGPLGQFKLTRKPVVRVISIEVSSDRLSWTTYSGARSVSQDGMLTTALSFAWVRVTYVTGFTYATLPQRVKLACARLTAFLQDEEGLSGNIKLAKSGGNTFLRFANRVWDQDTLNILSDLARVVC